MAHVEAGVEAVVGRLVGFARVEPLDHRIGLKGVVHEHVDVARGHRLDAQLEALVLHLPQVAIGVQRRQRRGEQAEHERRDDGRPRGRRVGGPVERRRGEEDGVLRSCSSRPTR